MSQRDRDRLVVLRNLKAKRITQTKGVEQLGVSTRQVRRMLERFKTGEDRAVVHGLRGRPSKRKLSEETREQIVRILSQDVYRVLLQTREHRRLCMRALVELPGDAEDCMDKTGVAR